MHKRKNDRYKLGSSRFPWGEEAFAKARDEQKLVFLSVGYSTCHWCHVMEKESFENKDIAKIMNADFVCIKVDREERPDVDKIYMTFIQVSISFIFVFFLIIISHDLKF